MWDEIAIIEQRMDKLLDQALRLTSIANKIGDLAHDIAVEANTIRHELKDIHRFQDDLK